MDKLLDYFYDIVWILIGLALMLLGGALAVGIGFGGVAGAFGGANNMTSGQITMALVLLSLAAVGLLALGRWISRSGEKYSFLFIFLTGFAIGLAIVKGWKWLDYGLSELKSDPASSRT